MCTCTDSYFVCLGVEKYKSVNEDLSLLTKISSPELHSAPLNNVKYHKVPENR